MAAGSVFHYPPAVLSPADRQPLLQLADRADHLRHPSHRTGLHLSQDHEEARRGRPLPLVVAPRWLDVRLLYYLRFYTMEKTPPGLEVVRQYFADFTPHQLQQLAALGDLYAEWNAKINVISRKDIDSLYEKHILHSLAIAAAFHLRPGMEVIDIGTGGGFPGIPLALFFPETRFHLVDSIGKKIKVVEAVAAGAGLTNIT